MKPSLTDQMRRLWWRGREGKCLLRSISKAKRFQRNGRDAEMRSVLSAADFAVAAIQRDEFLFAKHWQTLLRFQLAVFDFRGAEETVRRAKSPVAAEVMEILAQTAAWGNALDSARASMQEGWKPGADNDSLLIFLPSTAMGLETTQQPGLRTGLRMIFGEILATCLAEGIPVEVRGRLANHGTPPDETGRRYISHHTRSDKDGGLHIKVTDLPGCFSIDERGYSGWSRFSQTPLGKLNLPEVDLETAEKFLSAMRQRIIGGNVSKYQQTAADAEIHLPETYVFLALQVIDDAVQTLAHLSMLEMLAEVAETCRKRNLALVVKRHPRCNSRKVSKALEAGKFQLSEASIHDLISRSCAVCVVNSSVGAEALLHGKPVYVFGEAEYQHVCFRMRSKGDFEKQFTPHEMPVSSDDLTRFLYLLRTEYALDTSDLQVARQAIRRRVLDHVKGKPAEK
jgi:hypothetical protein